MQLKSTASLTGIKESEGVFENKEAGSKGIHYSSTTFHIEVDLPENGSGRSLGRVSRPFKFGDAKEFNNWTRFTNDDFPIDVDVVFEFVAQKDDKSSLKLVGIKPAALPKKP